ncbi:MAG: SPASM domain-containing protein [Hyphomicrobiales bacterium]
MFREHPVMASIFTMKNFRGYEYVRRMLQDEGILTPTIWRCEAVLGQYVFDPFGGLYTCFEGAGNEKAKIGTYYPEFKIDNTRKQEWDSLNAVQNPVCGRCKYRFVCTSGCPLQTVNEGKTECLPIEDEMRLAWNFLGNDAATGKSRNTG